MGGKKNVFVSSLKIKEKEKCLLGAARSVIVWAATPKMNQIANLQAQVEVQVQALVLK